MQQGVAFTTENLSWAAVVSFVTGLLALSGPWLFPAATIWLDKTMLPGHVYLGSAAVLVPPLIAIVTGHLAMSGTRPGRLRGRTIAVAGLFFGYIGLVTTAAFELLLWLIIFINPIGY